MAAADIIVAYKEFPHVDQAERAVEVVDLTMRAVRGEISRRRDCHSAAPPSPSSRFFNSDGERARQKNDRTLADG